MKKILRCWLFEAGIHLWWRSVWRDAKRNCEDLLRTVDLVCFGALPKQIISCFFEKRRVL